MPTANNKNKWLLLMLLCSGLTVFGQKKSDPTRLSVYKIDQLLNRIHNTSDTVYVVNFWATWCKPCVAELPDFRKADSSLAGAPVKFLFVSLDFREELDKRLRPFLKKNHYTMEFVLLDESDANMFINKIDPRWTGAIPATYITTMNKTKTEFLEKKMNYEVLMEEIRKMRN